MKRNDIVFSKKEQADGWILYGRIWRILPDGRLVVVCGGSHVSVYQPDELVLSDYKGTIRKGRYVRMDSLRVLKRWAAKYNPHFGTYWNAWGRRWTKKERKAALENLGNPNYELSI
jgi:hypothetical protein